MKFSLLFDVESLLEIEKRLDVILIYENCLEVLDIVGLIFNFNVSDFRKFNDDSSGNDEYCFVVLVDNMKEFIKCL